jgi:hypothetical protein
MTLNQLAVLCKNWQSVLRLKDWDIKVGFSTRNEMVEGARGLCIPEIETKTAIIRVLEEKCYDDGPWPYDAEETLIHELLHLHFLPMKIQPDTAENTAQEQAINLISAALVELKKVAKRKG